MNMSLLSTLSLTQIREEEAAAGESLSIATMCKESTCAASSFLAGPRLRLRCSEFTSVCTGFWVSSYYSSCPGSGMTRAQLLVKMHAEKKIHIEESSRYMIME